MNVLYLASPYSHPDQAVRQQRYEQACKAVAYLMKKGVAVFSPIAHGHGVAVHGHLDTGYETWRLFDEWMMSKCCAVLVLKLDGWHLSDGIQDEGLTAECNRQPIKYVEPDRLDDVVTWYRRTYKEG